MTKLPDNSEDHGISLDAEVVDTIQDIKTLVDHSEYNSITDQALRIFIAFLERDGSNLGVSNAPELIKLLRDLQKFSQNVELSGRPRAQEIDLGGAYEEARKALASFGLICEEVKVPVSKRIPQLVIELDRLEKDQKKIQAIELMIEEDVSDLGISPEGREKLVEAVSGAKTSIGKALAAVDEKTASLNAEHKARIESIKLIQGMIQVAVESLSDMDPGRGYIRSFVVIGATERVAEETTQILALSDFSGETAQVEPEAGEGEDDVLELIPDMQPEEESPDVIPLGDDSSPEETPEPVKEESAIIQALERDWGLVSEEITIENPSERRVSDDYDLSEEVRLVRSIQETEKVKKNGAEELVVIQDGQNLLIGIDCSGVLVQKVLVKNPDTETLADLLGSFGSDWQGIFSKEFKPIDGKMPRVVDVDGNQMILQLSSTNDKESDDEVKFLKKRLGKKRTEVLKAVSDDTVKIEFHEDAWQLVTPE